MYIDSLLNKYLRTYEGTNMVVSTYSGFQAAVNTPEGKILRFVRPVAPEIFDRVAFERELKRNFAS